MGKEKNTVSVFINEGTAHRVGASSPQNAGSVSEPESSYSTCRVGRFELATKPRRGPSLLSKTLGTFQCANCGRWGKGGDFTDHRGFLCGTCLRRRGKGGQGMR